MGGRRERLAGTNSLAEIYSAKSDGAIRLGRLLTWSRVRPRPSPPLCLVLRFATEFKISTTTSKPPVGLWLHQVYKEFIG